MARHHLWAGISVFLMVLTAVFAVAALATTNWTDMNLNPEVDYGLWKKCVIINKTPNCQR